MSVEITLTIPDELYSRAERLAVQRQQDVAVVLAESISLADGVEDEEPADVDADMEREKAAYIKLHPQLKKQFLGRYVAVYQGELVDHDDDYGTLFERIDDQYPDVFVWLTKVTEEPMPNLKFYSTKSGNVSLTEVEKLELDRRLVTHHKRPKQVILWEEAKKRVKSTK